MNTPEILIYGHCGRCGDRDVFIGFAPASVLYKSSFPDLLDESTGKGYQRRFHREHSLEFKRYIQQPGASTIPLTFNIRPEFSNSWSLQPDKSLPGISVLRINADAGPVMAQVDCQHRLGYLQESPIQFAFMAYIGLTVSEEMEIFRIINGKAKGLSGSLLDFTEAKLTGAALSTAKPELYIALRLQEDPSSPWYRRLDMGGKSIVSPMRQASLRTMQRATKRFLKEASIPAGHIPDIAPNIVIDFWKAVSIVAQKEWNAPRAHMITKGVGVYSLMSLAGILVREAREANRKCDLDYFIAKLSDFICQIDWSNQGTLQGYGGASGANAVLELMLHMRNKAIEGTVIHG
jgi:DNA sulfur modification protein DndB